MVWNSTGGVSPRSLGSARLQLHYGAYVLGSTAHSVLPHRPDDSHTNLGYDEGHGSFKTRDLGGGLELHLDIEPFEFRLRSGSAASDPMPLAGRSLDELMLSIGRSMSALGVPVGDGDITRRDYPDFPTSPIMTGAPFQSPPAAELRELRIWFGNAAEVIDELRPTEPQMGQGRIWPHHFDVGALVALSDDGERSIGLGFAPGDGHFDQPYFYCAPYPQPDDGVPLPQLTVGDWTRDSFVAAILTGEAIQQSDAQAEAVRTYLTEAVASCRAIVLGGNSGNTDADGADR